MEAKVKNLIQHSEVSEKVTEQYLVREAARMGLLCLKYSNANTTGYPDRILLLPGCRVIWIELKSKGRKPTKLQRLRAEELKAAGQAVFTADSKECINEILSMVKDNLGDEI